LNEVEIGNKQVKITTQLTTTDIQTLHCDKAFVNDIPIELSKLAKTLTTEKNDSVTIKLSNKQVSAEFLLRYEIATAEDLDGIDKCFLDVSKRGQLDNRAIEYFISTAHQYPSAMGYCDGICEYFYGVLIKEGSSDIKLNYDRYTEKFNHSVELLKDFNRPISRTICALIEFHFNHFAESISYAKETRVGRVSALFESWLTSNPTLLKTVDFEHKKHFENIFTDCETEKIIKWSILKPDQIKEHLYELESSLDNDISGFDSVKLHILLTEYYMIYSKYDDATRHAKGLRNNTSFEEWTEGVFTRINIGSHNV